MGLIIVAAATRRRVVEVCVMVDGCWCVVRRPPLFLCDVWGDPRRHPRDSVENGSLQFLPPNCCLILLFSHEDDSDNWARREGGRGTMALPQFELMVN
jgi:hypothetical protein